MNGKSYYKRVGGELKGAYSSLCGEKEVSSSCSSSTSTNTSLPPLHSNNRHDMEYSSEPQLSQL